MLKLGVLGSTRGTALQGVIDAIEKKQLNASIELVISNKPDALILERAKKHALKALFVSPNSLSREAYDAQLSALFQTASVDYILLIGYMKILSKNFTDTWQAKLLNIHPSLLPKFGGLMDKAVHQAVLKSGDKTTGCTIHFVDHTVDGGEILLQKTCPVNADDTTDSLKATVQQLEKAAFVEAIQQLTALKN